jgi:hypothetical protein
MAVESPQDIRPAKDMVQFARTVTPGADSGAFRK